MDDIHTNFLRLSSFMNDSFIQYIENLVLRDVNRWREDSVINSGVFSSVYSVYCTKSYTTSSSSQPQSSNHDIFEKGIYNCINDTGSVILYTSYTTALVPIFLKGLRLPIVSLKYAGCLAISPWRYFFSSIRKAQVQVHRLISRAWITLRGSSDDIGWLQQDPSMPPVEDGTPRFLKLLSDVRNGKHSLPNTFVYLLIPGLFSNHGPLYFVATKKFFSKMGLACHIAKVHSEASVEHNAWELKLYIEELYWGSGKRVMLLGHSKGGVDAAAALSLYWSDLKDKVAGLALVQSPYGGTPVASDMLREDQIGDKETRRIMELIICKVLGGDISALKDLTYERRKDFIMKHKLPPEIPVISFHSEASIGPGVFTTMSYVAHAEVPWISLKDDEAEECKGTICIRSKRQVPVVMPASAAMAISALHLQLRYGEKSDGLVTCRDAEVPGSVVVRPDKKLDHSWMVYSSNKRNPREPDASEMCEALMTLLVELGRTKESSDTS